MVYQNDIYIREFLIATFGPSQACTRLRVILFWRTYVSFTRKLSTQSSGFETGTERDEITRFSLWTGIGSARSLVKGLFECVLRADLTAESARSLEKGSEREYSYQLPAF